MQLETPQSSITPAETIFRLYSRLVATVSGLCALDRENGLGGKLVYAGELGQAEDEVSGRQLIYAANIAGAASIAATCDALAQKQAIRDGVVDFFVTTLEEALRILKNEVRKRQTVSVGVAAAPSALVAEMLRRGVQPDVLPPLDWAESRTGLTAAETELLVRSGARTLAAEVDRSVTTAAIDQAEYVTWSTEREAARWLPKLSLCAQSAIASEDMLRQRWLRLAPRYLGRMASRQHGVPMSVAELALFRDAARKQLYSACATACSSAVVEIGGETISAS